MSTRKAFVAWLCLFATTLASPAWGGELGDFLRATLAHPQVQVATVSARGAEMQLEAASARYLGNAALIGAWHQYEGPRIVGVYTPGTAGLPLSSERIGQAGIVYSVPLDVFRAIAANRERAKHDLAAAELVARQQTLLKLHQAASAYVTLQALLKQREALAAYRQRVMATHERITHEVQLGRTAGVEARYTESELARLEADEALLAGALAQAQADLAEASARDSVLPADADIRVPALDGDTAETSLPARIALARSEAAAAQGEEARRALYPSVSVDASYFRNADNVGGHRDTWAIGLAISVPLSLTQNRQARAQQLAADAAREQSRAAALDAARQSSALRATYEAAGADIRALEKEQVYRSEVALVQREMHRLGNQTLENLVRHERDLLDARFRLAQAKARATVAWSSIEVLAGLPPETYIARMDPR